MPAPLHDKNEIKIFTLFLMDKIGYPLDYNNIASIVVQDGVVRYFDFADCFYHICDTAASSMVVYASSPSNPIE